MNAPSTTGGTIEQVEGHITAPTLAVPIPGLSAFQNPTVQGSDGQQYLDIPFLAQYISAVYTYALGIIVTIATVMVVIGGLKWMLARGDSGKVSDAKETLSRAVIGVLLALGSYAILNLLNPELVNLRALRIQLVSRLEMDALDMTNTDTIDPDDASGGGRSSGTAPLRSVSGGTDPGPAASFSGCPVTLTNPTTTEQPETNARRLEFATAIVSVATGATPRERIVKIAEAAAKCQIYMGCCGCSAIGMNRIAGISGRGRATHAISREQKEFLRTVHCANNDGNCRGNSRRAVIAKLAAEIPNWPDVWANDLRPGDVFHVFNANSSPYGTHAAIFMGWGSGGRAKVIQGSPGKIIRAGGICIRSSCGDRLTPLTHTFTAGQ